MCYNASVKRRDESVQPMTTASVETSDDFATRLRGFGPIGLLAIVVILAGNGLFTPLGAIPVLFCAHHSDTPWRDIGYVRPQS